MLVISVIALVFCFLIGAILFVDCKIVDDLPEDNEFKKWWRANIIAPDPEG